MSGRLGAGSRFEAPSLGHDLTGLGSGSLHRPRARARGGASGRNAIGPPRVTANATLLYGRHWRIGHAIGEPAAACRNGQRQGGADRSRPGPPNAWG